jgi:predicted metal-dependent HD superfamily phosphohydrolase
MPDSNLEIVSSSWVKGLIGKYGWQKVVKNSVPNCVFKNLQERELNKEIDNIVGGILKENNINSSLHQEPMIRNIKESIKAYRNRPYHNYEHILDGFEVFKSLREHWQNSDNIMLYAWLMHDVDPSEDKSIEIALSKDHMPFLYSNFNTWTINKAKEITSKIKTLIEATKHNTCEYNTEEEKLFVSVDLMNLGGSNFEYDSYYFLVCDEYREKDKIEKGNLFNEDNYFDRWIEGRLSFTKRFLDRKYIYPSSRRIFKIREDSAKQNLKREMLKNQDYINSINNDDESY